ncbi:Menaquinone reductase [Trichinella spiralis]|uniref:Menaquinone reductase n=1 Tax=Trichinella spiralis TaxID=6334 RepID=A0ABR3K638_TRISP
MVSWFVKACRVQANRKRTAITLSIHPIKAVGWHNNTVAGMKLFINDRWFQNHLELGKFDGHLFHFLHLGAPIIIMTNNGSVGKLKAASIQRLNAFQRFAPLHQKELIAKLRDDLWNKANKRCVVDVVKIMQKLLEQKKKKLTSPEGLVDEQFLHKTTLVKLPNQ